jgi:hypothetical protein
MNDNDLLQAINKQLEITDDDVSELEKIKLQFEPIQEHKPSKELINNIQDQLNLVGGQSHFGKSNSKQTKSQLIEQILEVCLKTGISDTDLHEGVLKRKTKGELSKILGDLLNNGIDRIHKQDSLSIAKDCGVSIPNTNTNNNDTKISNDFSVDIGAKSLYNLNKFLVSITETINNNSLVDYTGMMLSDTEKHLEDRKEELMELYARIYMENASDIGKYMSPINLILLINAQTFAGSLVSKAKEDIEKN